MQEEALLIFPGKCEQFGSGEPPEADKKEKKRKEEDQANLGHNCDANGVLLALISTLLQLLSSFQPNQNKPFSCCNQVAKNAMCAYARARTELSTHRDYLFWSLLPVHVHY